MTVVTIARTTFDTSISRRGEMRSDSTPPRSRKAPRGRAAARRTVPNASPEPVIPSTSHDSAT